MEQSKYYTPDIQEFKIGFECEFFNNMQDKQWNKVICDQDHIGIAYTCFEEGTKEWEDDISQTFRVKYLDDKDIEECGFTTDAGEIPSKFNYYKLLPDKTIYQISPYWHMYHTKRENLVRIYKGMLHEYPYTEIFRGDIKNKSELKVLLKQLGIE